MRMVSMNLKYIQEKLNEMFKGDSRQLIFWYDDNAEFCEEIRNLKLNNAQIYPLKKDNWLSTKYFLECEDTETNYLIYAPFPRPDDKDNYLADMVYYSTPFCADKISLISQELNIPDSCKSVLKKYSKFWNANSRVNGFKKLNIEKYSKENIEIAILCVLSNVRILNFDEVLKKVLTVDKLNENKYLSDFEKMEILDAFWDLCEKRYGYFDVNPSIEKFLITLLITYTSTRFKGNTPKAWEKLLSEKQNNIEVFVNNIMSNINYKDEYDRIAAQIAKRINLETHLKRVLPENYYNCDTFEIFDKNIIEHLTDLLESNQEELPDILEILAQRKKTHFYYKYSNYYTAIEWANCLIRFINEFSAGDFPSTADEIIDFYCEKWSFIDRSYREFYYAYDQIKNTNNLQNLRQLVENMYTNTYLSKLAVLWSDKLKKYDSIKDLAVEKQFNFYNDNVKRSVRKHKTAVIISDALRYECGDELREEINKNPKRKAEIKPIISAIPSITSLGMACLLPHKKIEFDNNFRVLVDGKLSISSNERQKILESYYPDAMVVSLDEIISLKKLELRDRLRNKDLIYVYHNQIDARGDKLSTENEVFTASKEAIDEIIKLITRLTDDGNFTDYWITADHGFIYKRDKLDESDKVDLSYKSFEIKNKRFLLSNEKLNIEGTSIYPLDYLNNNMNVIVPKGVDIFKIKGAGQNYVHGGASLQEIIIPIINVESKQRGKKEQNIVELDLISLNRKITNLSSFLTFAQKENISNKILPLEAKLYFEEECGEKISNEVIIHANQNVESAQDREFREKFTLRNKEYSKNNKYYLVMKNMENDVEINRYEFIIDIAISDDFF